jgi:hypothetical protein
MSIQHSMQGATESGGQRILNFEIVLLEMVYK